VSSGWVGLFCWLSLQVPGSCRRVVRGPAGAPGAVGAREGAGRGRTSWTLASGGRWSGARKNLLVAGLAGVWDRWAGFPGAAWLVGVVSHAPIRHLPGGGCHDRDFRGPGCSVRSSSAA